MPFHLVTDDMVISISFNSVPHIHELNVQSAVIHWESHLMEEEIHVHQHITLLYGNTTKMR